MSHTGLGPGREFDVIRSLLARWGDRAVGIGDDAAVLVAPPGEMLVLSTDTSVEDVHFRRAWLSMEEIGWRAAMAGLSDLAAMGARPIGMLVSLNAPDDALEHVEQLADGIGSAAAAVDTHILGGDLSRGEALTIGMTVVGAARTPLRRSGAKAGDELWVTGKLGGPAQALRAWMAGVEPDALARERFARPHARIAMGIRLAALGATAAIDISDGLASDARHLAAASSMALEIALDALPCVPGSAPADAVTSGEEYELLVALPAGVDPREAVRESGAEISRVGSVLDGQGGSVTFTQGGSRVEVGSGYNHFSR